MAEATVGRDRLIIFHLIDLVRKPPPSVLDLCSREEAAEGTIEQLSRDRDPILRYGAMYAIGMAYCGTSNNKAIRRLLHVAVSDVSDDVRLAAVTCLGFVLFRTPEQVSQILVLSVVLGSRRG